MLPAGWIDGEAAGPPLREAWQVVGIAQKEKARQLHPWSDPANDAAGERHRDAVRVWGPATPMRHP